MRMSKLPCILALIMGTNSLLKAADACTLTVKKNP